MGSLLDRFSRILKWAVAASAVIVGLMCVYPAAACAATPASCDPREQGLVSGERDQAPWGMCWDFAGMMALESYLVTNGLAGADIDLSEEAVPWHVLAICREQLGSDQAFGWTVGRGTRDDSGYAAMMTGYFMSWLGPNLESDVPYYQGSDEDPMGIYPLETRPLNLDSASKPYQVTDIAYFENPTRDEVKEAVLAYGGVATGCNLSLDYYREDTAALWYPAPEGDPFVNHAVCIVGWDDNYPREKFRSQDGVLPGQNGAWLVKNSERSSGVAAYLWISYEDGAVLASDWFNPTYAIAGARASLERRVYAVDDLGSSKLVTSQDAASVASVAQAGASLEAGNTLTCANVYDFAENERISEVMFMSMAKGAAYRLLYLPVGEAGAPVLDRDRSIELACGSVEHAGYTTVELGAGVALPSGPGALAVELVSRDGAPSLGVDASVSSAGLDYATSRANADRSFFIVDGATVPATVDPNMPVKFVLRAFGMADGSSEGSQGGGLGGDDGEQGDSDVHGDAGASDSGEGGSVPSGGSSDATGAKDASGTGAALARTSDSGVDAAAPVLLAAVGASALAMLVSAARLLRCTRR